MTQKIFLIAGEPSGDALGAGLVRELKTRTDGKVEMSGVGGPLMGAEGFKTLLPMEELAVMGLWEVLWQLPRLLKLINGMVHEIEKRQPDAVVSIDLPDFNFEVAKRLKKRGVYKGKLVHYVAPTVWAWRAGRAKKIGKLFDLLLCLFPFEPRFFEPHGLKAVAVGHPLVEYGLEKADGARFRRENHIPESSKTLGLFLGSRQGELHKMAPVFLETVGILQEENPALEIIVPTLFSLEYDVLQILRRHNLEATVVSNAAFKWDAFAACDAGLAVSGTVGLELAYMGVPHVIAYKMHPLTWKMVRRMVKVPYAHLVNILLNKPVVPEYLQSKCSSLNISRGLLKLFKQEQARADQLAEFKNLRGALGANDAQTPSAKAAEAVLKLMEKAG